MHYIGYLLIALSLLFGYGQMHQFSVIVLALLATLVFARARRTSVKNERVKPGALVDGLFLFFVQLLVMFLGYALGYFFAYAASSIPTV